ncbi:MAG: nucleotidyltransferase domain-containing protein [Candidatus Aenigmatarchaeota archaeon]
MLKYHQDIIKEFEGLKATIILFGSVSRGNYRLDSDIDLAIISNNKKIKQKAENIADKILFKYGKVVSLKFFTKDDFYKKINKKDPFVFEIIKGKVIYNE